jgi:tryptophan synthase alpha chain
MGYYNPIFSLGEEKFIQRAVASGVDAVIIGDLPPDEGSSFLRLCRKYNLDMVCFISPTTSRKRMKYICNIARGFIYYVSLTGVTGIRRKLPADLAENLKTIKHLTDKPVCVGFGISNPQQVREISKIADGVIVGSAVIKKIKENLHKDNLVKIVGRFVADLKHV